MPIKDSREKFEHELADIYDAEHQFLEAQDVMLTNATDPKLKSLIEQHIERVIAGGDIQSADGEVAGRLQRGCGIGAA